MYVYGRVLISIVLIIFMHVLLDGVHAPEPKRQDGVKTMIFKFTDYGDRHRPTMPHIKSPCVVGYIDSDKKWRFERKVECVIWPSKRFLDRPYKRQKRRKGSFGWRNRENDTKYGENRKRGSKDEIERGVLFLVMYFGVWMILLITLIRFVVSLLFANIEVLRSVHETNGRQYDYMESLTAEETGIKHCICETHNTQARDIESVFINDCKQSSARCNDGLNIHKSGDGVAACLLNTSEELLLGESDEDGRYLSGIEKLDINTMDTKEKQQVLEHALRDESNETSKGIPNECSLNLMNPSPQAGAKLERCGISCTNEDNDDEQDDLDASEIYFDASSDFDYSPLTASVTDPSEIGTLDTLEDHFLLKCVEKENTESGNLKDEGINNQIRESNSGIPKNVHAVTADTQDSGIWKGKACSNHAKDMKSSCLDTPGGSELEYPLESKNIKTNTEAISHEPEKCQSLKYCSTMDTEWTTKVNESLNMSGDLSCTKVNMSIENPLQIEDVGLGCKNDEFGPLEISLRDDYGAEGLSDVNLDNLQNNYNAPNKCKSTETAPSKHLNNNQSTGMHSSIYKVDQSDVHEGKELSAQSQLECTQAAVVKLPTNENCFDNGESSVNLEGTEEKANTEQSPCNKNENEVTRNAVSGVGNERGSQDCKKIDSHTYNSEVLPKPLRYTSSLISEGILNHEENLNVSERQTKDELDDESDNFELNTDWNEDGDNEENLLDLFWGEIIKNCDLDYLTESLQRYDDLCQEMSNETGTYAEMDKNDKSDVLDGLKDPQPVQNEKETGFTMPPHTIPISDMGKNLLKDVAVPSCGISMRKCCPLKVMQFIWSRDKS